MTSARAAKLAQMSLPQFLAHLSDQGIPVVDYSPTELEQELTAFEAAQRRGRQEAQRQGLPLFGMLGVLLQAKRSGKVAAVLAATGESR